MLHVDRTQVSDGALLRVGGYVTIAWYYFSVLVHTLGASALDSFFILFLTAVTFTEQDRQLLRRAVFWERLGPHHSQENLLRDRHFPGHFSPRQDRRQSVANRKSDAYGPGVDLAFLVGDYETEQ